MPPKRPRKRTPKSTARKSVPAAKASAISPAPDSTPTTDFPTPRPSSSSPEIIPFTSPKLIKTTKESSPQSTPLASSPENVAEKTNVAEDGSGASQPVVAEGYPEFGPKTLVEDSLAEEIGIPAQSSENAPAKTGGKTVVRRTVRRIVKRVVKKKVPKIVKKEDPDASCHEEIVNVGLSGVVETNPIESFSLVENPTPNDTVSREIENFEPMANLSTDVENPCPYPPSVVSMEVESYSHEVDGSAEVEAVGELEIGDTEMDICVNENISDVQPNYSAAKSGVDGAEEDFASVEGEGKGNEEVENGVIDGLRVDSRLEPLDVGVVLSGEMEALERRRRRETEIFVGGLDKETKDEDIRKVFELVGEVIDVRLVKDSKTGKSKGFAFVRYASAADAKTALVKYHKVEISGKQCGTAPAEGNDTIFLGNINKQWKSEDILKRLQEIGVEKIDKVTVVADPNNLELNRGFAFLELETKKDAQTAFNKLQKKDVFGKHVKVKVAWAEPLIEPDQKEMLKVKSVYAEYIPSSWDEEKVKDCFKRFGEIENVALARNLRSSRRKDFAFINYKTREAALACIKAFSREQFYDEGSKVNMKVSLAKPLAKGKQVKHVSKPSSMEIPMEKRKAALAVLDPHEPRNMGKSTSRRNADTKAVGKSSTTDELVQLLREQASWRQTRASSGIGAGSVDHNYLQPLPGLKRRVAQSGNDLFYPDPRGYPRMCLESSYSSANPRPLSQGVGMTSATHYDRLGGNYPSGPFYRVEEHLTYSQTRERAPYHGSGGLYRRH